MTEADLWELNALYITSAIDAVSVYLSFTFAYIAAAYLVGAKLTKFQAGLVSCMYVFAAVCADVPSTLLLRRAIIFQEFLAPKAESYGSRIFDLSFAPGYAGILLVAGILVSLYFMYDVRKKNP